MTVSLHRKKATAPTGRLGEALAAGFLVKQRYAIVELNYRKSYGEVDIIAQDGDTVVFVEVKTRKSSGFGTAFEAVDSRKQRQISRIAQEYLQSHGLLETPARFDVIAIRLDGDNRAAAIDHIKNAFDCVL
ncbi:MAG: YraN family protein [Desulfobulbus sp.]|jgi:putative endonuclease|uniref:YraN family protein n=1 Tax=Desulfobulbus sp. TaxID=895 RepID=UPI0028460DCC|nr:YraN family protein [Desulfobulbus sp.]MDR2550869.1 YraN family protein [Desulfobulbus sp.]